MTNQAIPAWAVPGARVVCVDDSPPDDEGQPGMFVKDRVYILSKVFVLKGHLLCQLREYAFDPQHNGRLNRFRPAVEPKSEAHDVALFEDIVRGMSLVERLDRIKESLDV